MNLGQRGLRHAANGTLSRDTVCATCRNQLVLRPSPRRHASAAAALAPEPTETAPIQPATSSSPEKAYALLAATVLSRPPLLTRELTPFEKAFYLYQKRLNERTSLPFSRYFYYRQGTPADKEWKRKFRGRKSAARDIGQYSGYGKDAWNDEVLVGDVAAEYQSQVQALLNDAQGKTIDGKELLSEEEQAEALAAGEKQSSAAQVTGLAGRDVPLPFSRTTDADRGNDQKSLNRKLDRILYLLIQNKAGDWRFPEDRVHGRENLHQAAERILVQACGINMNTWVVGNHPIGHHALAWETEGGQGRRTQIAVNSSVPTSQALDRIEFGEKVFFMKGRIMAGQADLRQNAFGDRDFRWLTKEEIEEKVTGNYWRSIRNMLTER